MQTAQTPAVLFLRNMYTRVRKTISMTIRMTGSSTSHNSLFTFWVSPIVEEIASGGTATQAGFDWGFGASKLSITPAEEGASDAGTATKAKESCSAHGSTIAAKSHLTRQGGCRSTCRHNTQLDSLVKQFSKLG